MTSYITITEYIPYKASLVISKKAAGVWIKLPCIDNFGSCDYPDLCQILSSVGDCPDPIVSSGLGCQCPFKSVSSPTIYQSYLDFAVTVHVDTCVH